MTTKQDAVQIANEIFDFLKDFTSQKLGLFHSDLEAEELRKKNEEDVIEINKEDQPEEIQMGSYTITYKYKYVKELPERSEYEVIVSRKGQRVYFKKSHNGYTTVIFD